MIAKEHGREQCDGYRGKVPMTACKLIKGNVVGWECNYLCEKVERVYSADKTVCQ
jgi:hypothetical protein